MTNQRKLAAFATLGVKDDTSRSSFCNRILDTSRFRLPFRAFVRSRAGLAPPDSLLRLEVEDDRPVSRRARSCGHGSPRPAQHFLFRRRWRRRLEDHRWGRSLDSDIRWTAYILDRRPGDC